MYWTEKQSSESKIESDDSIEQYRYFGISFQPQHLVFYNITVCRKTEEIWKKNLEIC